jgi:hypothetical protein
MADTQAQRREQIVSQALERLQGNGTLQITREAIGRRGFYSFDHVTGGSWKNSDEAKEKAAPSPLKRQKRPKQLV